MKILTLLCSLIGAAAWIPTIVNVINIRRRKIKGCIVDYRVISKAEARDSTINCKEEGTILMLGINFFVSYKTFFAKDYDIDVKLKNGGQLKGILLDGSISETNTGKRFFCPVDYNFNLHREFLADRDNIRIVSMMIKSAAFSSINEIEEIKFSFSNEMVDRSKIIKTVIFKAEDFPCFNQMNFIDSYFS